MRTRSWSVALALAAAAALVVTGIAVAGTASNGNDSDVSLNFQKSKQPKNSYKKGSLEIGTSTDYGNPGGPGNGNPGGAVSRVQLYLDDDFKFNTSEAAKCNPASVTGSTQDMADAMAACGNAFVGKGTSHGFDPFHPTTATLPGCVLTFNGTKLNGHSSIILYSRLQVNTDDPPVISCADPANNHDGNTTVVLQGELKGASGDFGTQLDVNNIDDAAALPLLDFGSKIKHGKYAAARCHDGNHKWNLKGTHTYNDNVKTNDKDSQKCKVK